ncbi:GNAT family N-acetyltransferase [Clostridium saccharobutylicum]|uniref:Acetyltransferase n=1 Tax=Clostridium saccharobutylicum TaxID=169679 RepID=A0A1S8MNY8_CLOSA|nr:GNAT family N-acetyltransferase [Clostridium saccharobutylicum]OOM05837.1 acetyltransferase [Clostridium saccharobutylicum]OOM14471.1 acetyltransferase [Clostridium saccharobutylicum]
MIIEKLKVEDLSQVLELHSTLIPFEISFDKSFETYKEMLTNENYYLVVVKEDNEVIGSAIGICCKCLAVSFLVIEDVVVKEGLRGKGIGRKLMESLDEFAKTKECAYAILVSSDYRKNTHKFYENSGFTDSVRGFRKVY